MIVKSFRPLTRMLPCLLACGITIAASSQTVIIDSLNKAVALHPQKDSIRVKLLNELGKEARKSKSDYSLSSFTEALAIAQSIGYKQGEAMALLGLGFYYRFTDESPKGLEYTLKALPLFVELKDTLSEISCYYNITFAYYIMSDLKSALENAMNGLRLAETMKNDKWIILFKWQLGNLYRLLKDMDRSYAFYAQSMALAEKGNDKEGMVHALDGLVMLYELKKNWDSARIIYERTKALYTELHDPRGVLQTELAIASMKQRSGDNDSALIIVHRNLPVLNELSQTGYLSAAHSILASAHLQVGNPDSALYYGLKAVNATQRSNRLQSGWVASKLVAEAYAQKGNYKEAYRYQLLSAQYLDSTNLSDAIKISEAMQYSFELEKKQSQISLLQKNEELRARESRQQKILLFGALAGLLVLVGFSVVLWKNNKQKQRAYALLMQQQLELKATQAQLIQSEKMASLGELTAGIAHEIQNPLNFVNNFAEVNTELADELKKELATGNWQQATELASDIKENSEKINHHGKRADAIVKGMLQHSRASTGQKEPTDVNALADEYLRLAYHGFRAKDKSFNARLVTDFDTSIGKIPLIPQDFGRVLLNLLNNAFGAVIERQRQQPADYEPTITVSSKQSTGRIEIRVKDNGTGIPQPIVDKIFQPFFTTKPAGQGTGLGLSLSYDIVKAHGGELQVESKEGETIFTVSLPV